MPLHSLRRLVQRLFRPTRPVRHSAPGRRTGSVKIRLEALEDRTVPSTVNWVGGSGDWGNANNWLDATTQTHHTPTASDDAVINVAGVTVTHSSGSDTVHSLTSEDAVVLSGGTLTLNSASVIDNTFTESVASTFTGTTLAGAGNLTVNGLLTWTGGTMTGTGHTVAAGGLAINGSSDFFNPTRLDGRTLDNTGTATWTGTGTIDVRNGAVINNLAGATFNVKSDAAISSGGGAAPTFNNAGTFTKLDSSGTTTIGIAFKNSGTVDVQTGTLSLTAGSDSTGSFVAESGATLGFGVGFGGGTTTLRPSSNVSGGGTVVFSGGTATVAGTYSVQTTNLTGATVNFAHNATLGTLNLSGGTLTGFADVTVTDVLNWTGGTMSGPGSTTSTGTLTISGLNGKTLDTRTLNNGGTATWTGTDLGVVNGAVINNRAGAVFDDRTDANLGGFSSSGTFNNAGTFTKTQSTGQTTATVTFNSSGTVEVQTGTLAFINNSSDSGTFTVDAGTTLTFAGGTHTLTGTSAVNGAGNVQFTAGTNNILGTFAPGGTVTVSGGTANFVAGVDLASLTFTGGTITGSGTVTVENQLNWTAGTMSGPGTTVSNGTLNLSPASFSSPTLDGRMLVNNGTAVFTAIGIAVNNGAVLDNAVGATFLAEGNGTISSFAGGMFTNEGDFRKTSSSGTTTLSLVFNNTGSVEVETGTLNPTASGTSGGSMSVSAGATLLFTGSFGSGPYTLAASSSVDGDGTVQVGTAFGSNTLNVAGSYAVANTDIMSGTLNLASDAAVNNLTLEGGTLTGTGNLTVTGTLNWTGGAMTGLGTTTSTGALNISGSNSKDLNGGTLVNQGTATWTGSGTLTVRNGAVLDNQAGATFLIHNDSTLSGGGFGDTAGSFSNEGTLRKEASSGTTTVAVPFQNSGTVEVHTGTLSFTSGAYTQTGGTTLLSGGTLTASGGVNLQGGSLAGTGTVNGNVTNAGEVSPGGDGAVGVLTINGSYTQTDAGLLTIDLGGTTAGTQYDQLRVTGAASLGGTLTVDLINGFSPAAGNSFQVLTFASRTGNFATENFPDLGTLSLSPVFNPSNLTLAVHGNATLAPAASGAVDQVSNTVGSIPYISNNDNNHYSAILEYDLSAFQGGTLTSAMIAGTVFVNNSLDEGPRTIAIEVFAGHSGGVSVGDATVQATTVGTVTYHPPVDNHVDFSIDITSVVQSLLNSGATFIGVRFRGVNSPQAPSVLDTSNLPTLTVTD